MYYFTNLNLFQKNGQIYSDNSGTVCLEETKMFLYVKSELKINGKEIFGKYSKI